MRRIEHGSKTCVQCRGTFVRRRDARGKWEAGPTFERRKFCSPECGYVHRTTAPAPKDCLACGKQLILRRPSERGRKKFCSIECVGAVKRVAEPKATKRDLEIAEDVKWIIGTDTPLRIAERVGYGSVHNLERTLHRAGEHELANRLKREHSTYLGSAP